MDEVLKNLVGPYGALFLLILIGFTGFTGKWVFSYVMTNAQKVNDDILADKDKQIAEAKATAKEWQAIALRALNVSEKAVKTKETDG